MRKWEAVGILELLWHFTAKFAPAGDIGKFPDSTIAKAIDWNRATDRLVDALVESRWLDRCTCHRLVIHDWWDHADDSVHMKLARARERFADGTTPHTKRLPKDEKAHADEYYVQNPCARKAHGVQRADGKPLPLPLPKPEPLPEPTPKPEVRTLTPMVCDSPESGWIKERWNKHPIPGALMVAERAAAHAHTEHDFTPEGFEASHDAWCEHWASGESKPCTLEKFIVDGWWRKMPPRLRSEPPKPTKGQVAVLNLFLESQERSAQ